MTRLADRAHPTVSPSKSTRKKLKISVLYGGPSSEREVSLKSGTAVALALESLGHDVERVDLHPDNLGPLDRPMDMAFIALHGSFGEDGRLQQILDERGIRYCGSGAVASALAMDKVSAKCRFIEHEVPTPPFEVVTADRIDRAMELRKPPVVVKPICEGSSVDCQMIHDATEFRRVLTEMTGRYKRCLVENYIQGLELTVGILGRQALPPIQIRTRRSFYDYQAKYLDNDTEYLFEIDLPRRLLGQIQDLSVQAHEALGCRDFSRVDWMVDASTHQPYALEVNTIPGFTDHSLLPKAAAQAGLSFAALCQRIVELACDR
jgi:D-alanine-D-alanine ligase